MQVIWEQIKKILWDFINGYGKTLVLAVVFFVVGLTLISVIKKSVKRNTLKSRKIDNAAGAFVTSVTTLVAYVFLFVLIIATFGFSTSSLVTAFSSVVIAISLGLQDTLASLANGILLIFTKPFQAGDFVDIGGTSGTVKEIKLFSVKLTTTDNLTIIIPNNTVFGETITNYSKMPLRRLEIVIPVHYDVDVKKTKSLIDEIVKRDQRISKEPAPFFRLTEYGASSLNFTLRVWTKVGDFWSVKFDLLETILEELRAKNIEIPYNQLDVHVVQSKEA